MKPPLKWVGGKTRLLAELRKRLPKKIRRCYEPFAGGAALFFDQDFDQVTLGDINHLLIVTYQTLATHVDDVIEHLRGHVEKHCSNHYYLVREELNEGAEGAFKDAVSTTAAMLYLNKTCFNGLWRVNREGRFNVPMGRYKNPKILDEKALRAAAAKLAHVDFVAGDFLLTSAGASRGDFVYFDPPYVPVNKTANFTTYSEGGFGLRDQEALADRARSLARRGVNVMLSNSDTPLVRELYATDFRIDEVRVGRSINSKASARGKVGEVIITSYDYTLTDDWGMPPEISEQPSITRFS